MKQIEFKTSKGEFIVIDMDTLSKDIIAQAVINSINNFKGIIIGDNMYEEVGSIINITEEQAKEVVDYDSDNNFYKCGEHEVKKGDGIKTKLVGFDTATKALKSLLEANGVVFENPLGEFPDWRKYASSKHYMHDSERWQESQSKVWNNIYLFKKI